MDDSFENIKCSNNNDSVETFLKNCKRKPNLIETDQGKKIYNSFFHTVSNKNNVKHFSGCSSLGSVLAERFNHSVRDLLKKPTFERCDSN